MHKSLTIALHLRRTGICRRHLGKVGIHARIPATETHYALIGFEVADIETLAGGAYESTRSATEAGFAEFVPDGKIEQLV